MDPDIPLLLVWVDLAVVVSALKGSSLGEIVCDLNPTFVAMSTQSFNESLLFFFGPRVINFDRMLLPRRVELLHI